MELINDILDLSKIEAGKVELDLEAVEIPSLCDECLRMVQPRADAKQLQLSLQLDYRLDRVVGDPRRMRQMAINLLSNAIKFTPQGGRVELDARLADGSEVDSSLARRHEGTELGLALTKRLAELHGGTVSFQSQSDRGSKFRIWLPVVEPCPTQEEERNRRQLRASRPQIQSPNPTATPTLK